MGVLDEGENCRRWQVADEQSEEKFSLLGKQNRGLQNGNFVLHEGLNNIRIDLLQFDHDQQHRRSTDD